LFPTIIIQAAVQDVEVSWQDAVADAWREMPERAQQVANGLVASITIVNPGDSRLNLGYTQDPRAALIDDNLVLSCAEDAGEIWHEVGHAIVDEGLTPEEQEVLGAFYKRLGGQQTLGEKLSEDFYFTVKGDKPSPFWQWWCSRNGEGEEMKSLAAEKIAKLMKTAGVGPLQIVDAVLDAFAEELIYDFGGEEHIWYYGIAKEALNEASKEDRLSYENRSAPHQYYFTEDLLSTPPRGRNIQEPLRVDKPDVTMRGQYTSPPVV